MSGGALSRPPHDTIHGNPSDQASMQTAAVPKHSMAGSIDLLKPQVLWASPWPPLYSEFSYRNNSLRKLDFWAV